MPSPTETLTIVVWIWLFVLYLLFGPGKDPDRIDRLVRNSALYRDKWEREDYREGTIQKAIESCSDVYHCAEEVEPEPNWEDYPIFRQETTQEEVKPEKPQRLEAYHIKDLYRLPKMTWQIDKHLFPGSRVLVYGRWGSGKSFFATDMALSSAHGVKFLGKYNTGKMPVVYLAGEGQPGITKRVFAWLRYREVEPTEDFIVIPYRYNLRDIKDIMIVRDIILKKP